MNLSLAAVGSARSAPPGAAPAAHAGFEAVVFDLDGVLIDSFEVMRQAFARAYAEFVGPGRPPFEEYRTHQGRYFPDIMRLMNLPLEMEEPFVRASAELIGEITVYPGVRELLERLRDAGVATAVATGKSAARARAALAAHGLLPLLDTVVGSDEVPRPKPHPDIVIEALRRLRIDAPSRALMVGDAAIDIRSGRSAGTVTAGASWGSEDVERLRDAGADHVLSEPAGIGVLALAETETETETAVASAPANGGN
jgi:AHBA synthesis associated protein